MNFIKKQNFTNEEGRPQDGYLVYNRFHKPSLVLLKKGRNYQLYPLENSECIKLSSQDWVVGPGIEIWGETVEMKPSMEDGKLTIMTWKGEMDFGTYSIYHRGNREEESTSRWEVGDACFKMNTWISEASETIHVKIYLYWRGELQDTVCLEMPAKNFPFHDGDTIEYKGSLQYNIGIFPHKVLWRVHDPGEKNKCLYTFHKNLPLPIAKPLGKIYMKNTLGKVFFFGPLLFKQKLI